MSNEPQEPEYIVTKEQLETIENESADEYGDCMIPQEILDVIRSRPNHNTSPQVVYRCCEFYQAPTLGEPKASCKLVQGVRQDVTEKVLNKFYDRLKKERCKESDSVSMDDVDAIYISLRKKDGE